MNNKILIFLCFVSLVFAQCSKKNTDMVSDTKKEMSEMKDKAVAKAKTWRSTAPTAGPARNMSKGTKNRTKAEIDEAIDFIGASMNTSSRGMFGSTLTKHQDKLLDIMTDVLYNPTFPQEEFDKAKTQTLSGPRRSKS